MEQAGYYQALHDLLREEDAKGRNAWYQVRHKANQLAGYLADVRRAWRLAESRHAESARSNQPNLIVSLAEDQELSPGSVELQCRYALIIATLNSLASSSPPLVVAALVYERSVVVVARDNFRTSYARPFAVRVGINTNRLSIHRAGTYRSEMYR